MGPWSRLLVVTLLGYCCSYGAYQQRQVRRISITTAADLAQATRSYWNIITYNGIDIANFDPRSCIPMAYRPGDVKGYMSEQWAFAYGISRMDARYARKISNAVKALRMVTDYHISVIALKVGVTEEASEQLEAELREVPDVSVHYIDNPVKNDSISQQLAAALETNPNCCGIDEYVKIFAVSLPFDKVILLDLDATVLKSVDHLFACDADFMFASGPLSPLNAGMIVFRGNNPNRLAHMVNELERASFTYTNAHCFDNLGCGPCKFNRRDGPSCLGQEGPQGFLHYYFVKRADPSLIVAQISTCLYDYQLEHNRHPTQCLPDDDPTGLFPFIVHKPDASIAQHFAIVRPMDAIKRCRPNFWILGTHRGGAGTLHKMMSQHPSVVMATEPYAVTDETYNAKFENVPNDKIIGDSWTARLIQDYAVLPTYCGQKHVKFLILLRDPIERCISEVRHHKITKYNVSISSMVEDYVNEFENAVEQNPKWLDHAVPDSLNGWRSGRNCIYEGIYVAHIKRWFYFTSPAVIRIYFTEDMKQEPSDILLDALQFVGAEGRNRDTNLRRVQLTQPQTTDADSDDDLDPALLERLRQMFSRYNRLLETLIQRTVPWGY